ncbi:hypothetical protein BWI15_04060 [Kribbella sp. ALI-6-A]|uniref:hypothetical protein n=1 Tax=Kribbella sp. ALI-6-A TaxID=1933817 RepID=UPI00097C4B87|nr:hypothetical protein [Kribbella sp. ALI-6-A]ONI76492.1 hypothetical protein BWI15_04060 [Kribbella sp. ALI-6-A]
MFVRRLGSRRGLVAGGVAVAVLAGGATFASSSPHEPRKPTCSLDVPARVVINMPYLTPPVRRGADCAAAGVVEARWDAHAPDGALVHQLTFHNAPVSDLRLGSTAYLTARRDGRRITLTAHFGRYDLATAATGSWPGARGELQLRKPGNAVWTTFKHVTADSRGEATETFTLAARYDYRLVIPDTAGTWGSTSPKAAAY